MPSFVSRELNSFSIWVAGNNGSHCSRQHHQDLSKTKEIPQKGSGTWTQTWAQTWSQIIIWEPGVYFSAKWLFWEEEEHLWQSNIWDPVQRVLQTICKKTVAIYFPYTPQNRVCMHSLLICWIAASVPSPNGQSLTSPWMLAKPLH